MHNFLLILLGVFVLLVCYAVIFVIYAVIKGVTQGLIVVWRYKRGKL